MMMVRKIFLWGVMFQFVWILQLKASGPAIPLTRLGIEQGLSNNSVRCIYQDHNGFMWFGTYDGLNRYDGYGFKVFRNEFKDAASLPHNYIYTINEDSHNNLWVGTGQGIGVYNNLTSRFLPKYYLPLVRRKTEKIGATVNSIKTDVKGNVFMGTNGWGLLIQAEGTDTAFQLTCKKGNAETTDYNVQAIKIDENQVVWLFIQGVGLCRYDYSAHKILLINNSMPSATCMETDSTGNLWIGTNAGLFKYSIATNAFVKSYYETTGSLTSNNIESLLFDSKHQLWIGTEGGGVNLLDPATNRINYLLPGENSQSLSSESVFSIFEDKEGRKWMGTLKGGINIFDLQKNLFQTIVHDPLNPNSLINNFVSCFCEDPDNKLWIGTDGGGVSIWDREKNMFSNFRHEPDNAASLSNNLVTSVRQDYLGNTWIATYGGGINRFSNNTKTFEHFRCINNVTSTENKNVWLLYEDKEKDLWATTFATGMLYHFNRQLNRFEVFDQSLTDLFSITEDSNGDLWAGNYHQVINIDKKHHKHRTYEIGKPVRALFEDNTGNFWIGTEGGGLILFNRREGRIEKRYTDAEGLSNNSVLNILQDNSGPLWLTTFNGLSKFDPAGKLFQNFYQADGLQSNQFLYNAALKSKSGELVVGGIKGFNIFNPATLHVRGHQRFVILTGLRVNNTSVTVGSPYISHVTEDKVSALKIPYYEAVLSFDFAALEYTSPDKISYAYFLEGWDKGWNYTGNIRTANYTHLKEGTYNLHIKATNTEGNWMGNETVLKITVLPPWFRSWWAYALYLLVFCTGFYIVHIFRKRQERLKYQVQIEKINAVNERERAEKEHLIAEQQREIAENQHLIAENEKEISEKEKEIAAKEREINEKRTSFFTNIAHEFHSPLTLIINPVQDLLKSNTNAAGTANLKIIERNSKRLLSLVNQLLLFRKAEAEADKLNVSLFNLAELCQEVYLAFLHEAKAKKIRYSFESEVTGLLIYADREKTEIILYNLISNAVKYTPAGQNVLVAVKETDEHAEVIIKDTGYGFNKETAEKIFEKFYRAEGTDTISQPGFGIGLFLVRHFINLHQGKLSLQSEPGKGSTFLICFLKDAAHFKPEDIISDKEAPDLQQTVHIPGPVDPGQTDTAPIHTLVSEKHSILLIDDDHELRKYLADIFGDNFITWEANNGITGLDLARKHVPDIIISDIMMPGMTGIEVCTTIKASPELAHIPVLLLTATRSDEMQLRGTEGGANDYLTKPFSKELLVAKINALITNREKIQQYYYDEITQKMKSTTISEEDKAFLEKCVTAIEARTEDDQFSIEVLARDMGMSHSNLYKNIKSLAGFTVTAFIKFVRLRKAARLFIDTDMNINQVAFQIGIPDTKYFRENFVKQFGMTPSAFIKRYRKALGKGFQINKSQN